MRKYNITGKELGDALTGFKNSFGDGVYEEFIIRNEPDTIYHKFELYLNKNK